MDEGSECYREQCVCIGVVHKISVELCVVEGAREAMQILGEAGSDKERKYCCSWRLYILSHHKLAVDHLFAQ